MISNKLVLSLLFGFATLSLASTASADRGFYRCQQAQQDLAAAQTANQQALLVLSQIQNICGGALPCILAAQNHYNQTVGTLQQAQREVNWACGGQILPPRPHHPGPRMDRRGGRGFFPHRPR